LTSILGISAFYHDSAACIVINGKIVAAAQEERFTRIKHDLSYPKNAINFVLKFANLNLSDLDYIVFFEKPFLKFERLLETYLAFAPKGFFQFTKAMPVWLSEKLFQKNALINHLKNHDKNFKDDKKLFFSEHHLSHAASAFFPSPFEEAVVLTADGVGEWATTTVALGKGKSLEIKKEINFPHSIGLLYSAFTYYLGFKVNSGEYKVMGLAPYGKAKYYDVIINNLVDIKPDGTFKLDQSFFDYATGLKMINSKFVNLFGQKVRDSKFEKLTQFHMDIAASIQKVTEEIILRICKSLREEYQIKNLCLAGGVALNCVANGAILKQKIFDKIWVQPAAGDAGGSLGAALAIWHLHLKKERTININDSMQGSYLGPEFSQAQIEKELSEIGANFETLNQNEIIERTTERIIAGDAIGWFQGRMEFGPRALGGRSILGDPRSETMQKDLNMKVKYRESFRPFAPSVLEEDFRDWFDVDQKSPYMLIVANVANKHIVTLSEKENKLFGLEKLNVKRSNIPAVTHIDNSARIQTVAKNFNPIFYKLLLKFKEKTGCPILINTSFNVRGEPIVNSPKDAFNCFMGTELDTLVIGNCFLVKKKQSKIQRKNYKNNFSLD
jgi:carbamoyltransferase|tara:strand:- start:1221 stop:3059 length:1839 start_codon:yes stop_codon:yes gene_type:complete